MLYIYRVYIYIYVHIYIYSIYMHTYILHMYIGRAPTKDSIVCDFGMHLEGDTLTPSILGLAEHGSSTIKWKLLGT